MERWNNGCNSHLHQSRHDSSTTLQNEYLKSGPPSSCMPREAPETKKCVSVQTNSIFRRSCCARSLRWPGTWTPCTSCCLWERGPAFGVGECAWIRSESRRRTNRTYSAARRKARSAIPILPRPRTTTRISSSCGRVSLSSWDRSCGVIELITMYSIHNYLKKKAIKI